LGGSFNPAHEGHLAMSLHALRRLGLDRIWWLVSPQNPLKSTAGMAPLAKRLEGARRIARHPKIVVSDIEAKLNTRFTIDTLRELQRRFPRVQFVWLMGADNLGQMPHWRQWTEVFGMVPIGIFRRPGYAIGGQAAARFARSRRPMRSSMQLAALKPPAWLVLDNRLNLISATAIRRQARS